MSYVGTVCFRLLILGGWVGIYVLFTSELLIPCVENGETLVPKDGFLPEFYTRLARRNRVRYYFATFRLNLNGRNLNELKMGFFFFFSFFWGLEMERNMF